MRAVLFTAIVVASACGPAPAAVAPGSTGAPSCWWRTVPWDDGAPLLVPGTERELGRALASGTPGVLLGARVSGALQPGGSGLILRGAWEGDGLTLKADVDVSRHALLRAWAPTRLGEAGLVLAGGPVRVLALGEDQLLVAPPPESRRVFEPSGPEVTQLACADVTLRTRAARAPEASLEAVVVPRGARVAAVAAPGGATIGSFVAAQGPTAGVVLERRGAFARFAAADAVGTRWVGWVPAEALAREEPSLGAGAADGPRAIDDAWSRPRAGAEGAASWPLAVMAAPRACTRAQPLSVRSTGSELLVIGQLAPGTPFVPERREADGVVARVLVPWLRPAEGLELVLPLAAEGCPRAAAPAAGVWP